MAPNEDKRLDRLLDYTKFHIGIYLSIGGALVGLLGSDKASWVFSYLAEKPWQLGISLLFMVGAGVCGGVVASSTTICETFDEFWRNKQGPMDLELIDGKYWAMFEHIFFWTLVATQTPPPVATSNSPTLTVPR